MRPINPVIGRNGLVDRYFYFCMSLLFAVIVIAGFRLTADQNLFHPLLGAVPDSARGSARSGGESQGTYGLPACSSAHDREPGICDLSLAERSPVVGEDYPLDPGLELTV